MQELHGVFLHPLLSSLFELRRVGREDSGDVGVCRCVLRRVGEDGGERGEDVGDSGLRRPVLGLQDGDADVSVVGDGRVEDLRHEADLRGLERVPLEDELQLEDTALVCGAGGTGEGDEPVVDVLLRLCGVRGVRALHEGVEFFDQSSSHRLP